MGGRWSIEVCRFIRRDGRGQKCIHRKRATVSMTHKRRIRQRSGPGRGGAGFIRAALARRRAPRSRGGCAPAGAPSPRGWGSSARRGSTAPNAPNRTRRRATSSRPTRPRPSTAGGGPPRCRLRPTNHRHRRCGLGLVTSSLRWRAKSRCPISCSSKADQAKRKPIG